MASTLSFHDPATPEGRQALVDALRNGRFAALPTETVPGLAVLAGGREQAARLSALKGAPDDRPYSLHLRGGHDLRRLLPAAPPGLPRWLDRRMPGPFTAVLPSDWVALPSKWAWDWPTTGLRMPAGPGWEALAADLPEPLLMTSINRHGEAPLTGAALEAWLGEHPEVVCGIRPDEVGSNAASTVVSFEPLPVLRRGDLPDAELRPGMRVLVVCSGNICRSPLGAALLERELASAWGVRVDELGALGWVVASAGTYAMAGARASEHSQTAGLEVGVDLGGHRGMHVEEALQFPWDVVLCMGPNHWNALPRGPWSLEPFDPEGREVLDPYGGDLSIYRACREHMLQAIEARVRRWSSWPER